MPPAIVTKTRSRKQAKTTAVITAGKTLRSLVIGIVLSITFVAYSNTLFNGFAYDDNTEILKNQLIRSFSNLPDALTKEVWFWRVQQDKDPNKEAGPTTPYYRPVFTVYMMVAWHIFRESAPGWHLANLLLHLLVVYFVFLITEKISRDTKLSAIAALLFAVHPLRSESVAWICGVTDPLLGVFYLPAFYFYMLYREDGNGKHLLASLALFLPAAFSKEPSVSLPIFVAAYELFILNQGKTIRERVKPAALYGSAFLGVAALYFAMRYHALGFLFHDNKFTDYSFDQVLMTIPLVICKYIGLLLWPVNLSLFHATPLVKSSLSVRFILPSLIVLGLAVVLWRLRNSAIAKFAVLWSAVNLAPVLNLTAFDQNFMVQERYLYIPSIGFSILLAMALVRLPLERWIPVRSRRVAQVAVVTLICILFTARTLAQNTVWKDDLTLYSHAAEVAPDQPMSHYVLAHYYIKLARQRPDKVVEELERYMELDATNLVVISNLASARLQLYEATLDRQHLDRSIGLCEKGLNLDNHIPELWDTLGHSYTYDTELKNYDRARAYFTQALRLEPNMALSAFHMGATYVKQLDYENAIRYLELAREKQPDFPDTHKFLAYAYAGRGQIKDAIDSVSRSLELQPDAKDAPQQKQLLEKLRAKLESSSH